MSLLIVDPLLATNVEGSRAVWATLGRLAGLLLSVLFVVSGVRTEASDSANPAPNDSVLAEIELPADMRWVQDVRWWTEDRVVVSDPHHGVWEIPIGEVEVRRLLIPGGRAGTASLELPSWLGVSHSHVVTASIIRSLAWSARDSLDIRFGSGIFELVVDIDLHGDRLLVLGNRRSDDKRKIAPQGGIGWIGSLSRGLEDKKAVFVSMDGPGAESLDRCGPFVPGAVRFLADGSYVIMPGVEPGIFWYSPNGELQRHWSTEDLGLQDHCELSRDQAESVALQPMSRAFWLNRRRVVEDILDLATGPGLVVRKHDRGLTMWELWALQEDGSAERRALPVVSRALSTRLRIDLREDRLAILVTDPYSMKSELPDPPRLVIARLPSSTTPPLEAEASGP